MPNPFVHVELNTHDIPAAKKFYKSLFKWTLKNMKMGSLPYTMIDVGKGVGGGIMTHPMPNAPAHWLPYIHVDDVKKTMAKARALGAHIIVDYKEIEKSGSLAIFADPSGAVVGLWQTASTPPAGRRKPAKASKRRAR